MSEDYSHPVRERENLELIEKWFPPLYLQSKTVEE
jgi:hypothetical protein